MNDVPEDEAHQLLGELSYCDGCEAWTEGDQPGERIISSGLTDASGKRNRLLLELRFRPGRSPDYMSCLFSVFVKSAYTQRVYQLQVSRFKRRPKDHHQLPHEHFGDARTMGTQSWENWSYAEIMEYFSTRTKVVFRPVPPDPGLPPRRKK